jgi:hypothetical protein
MSWMRFAAGDPLFFEWTYLGRDPVQLHTLTLVVLCHCVNAFPEGRQGLCCLDEQYGLLDRIGSVYGVVGGEEPSWDLTENGTAKPSTKRSELKRKTES